MTKNKEEDKSFIAKAKAWFKRDFMIGTGFLCIGLNAANLSVGSGIYNLFAATTIILSVHDLINIGMQFYKVFKEFNDLRTGYKKIEEGKETKYIFNKACELGALTMLTAFTVLYIAFSFTAPVIKELGMAALALISAVRAFGIIKGTFEQDSGTLLLTRQPNGEYIKEEEPKPEITEEQEEGKWNNKPLKAFNLLTAAVGLVAIGLSVAAFVTAAPAIAMATSVMMQAYNIATIGKSCIIPLIKEIKAFREGKRPEDTKKYVLSKMLDAGLVLVALAGCATTIAATVLGGPLGLIIASTVTTALTQTLLFVKEGHENSHYTNSSFWIKEKGQRSTNLEQTVEKDFPMASKFVQKTDKQAEKFTAREDGKKDTSLEHQK